MPPDHRIGQGDGRVAGGRPGGVAMLGGVDIEQVQRSNRGFRSRITWQAASVQTSSRTTRPTVLETLQDAPAGQLFLETGGGVPELIRHVGEVVGDRVEPRVQGQLIAADVRPAAFRMSNRRGTRTSSRLGLRRIDLDRLPLAWPLRAIR